MENRATTQQIFALQMQAIRTNATKVERFQTDDRADRELVALTQKQMREALAKAREKGKSGWWNATECSTESLEELLQEAVKKGHMINVINYAAMINARRIADL
jgi:predicted kinase